MSNAVDDVHRLLFPQLALRAMDVPDPVPAARRLIAGVAAVLASAGLALLAVIESSPWQYWPWALITLLATLTVTRNHRVQVGAGGPQAMWLSANGALLICGVMLLPPLALPLLMLPLLLGSSSPLKRIWNTCAHLFACAVPAWAYWTVLGDAITGTTVDYRRWLAAALITVLLAWATESLVYGWLQIATTGCRLREAGVCDPRDLAEYGIGAVSAILVVVSPYFAPLAALLFALLLFELRAVSIAQSRLRDSLTGLLPFAGFSELVERERLRTFRTGEPLAILMLDLDNFSAINKRVGHLSGNEVIRDTVRIITEQLRAIDIPARFGGEEFIVALPGASSDDALAIAERIRLAIVAAPWTNIDPGLAVTTSCGVASVSTQESLQESIDRADAALYRAKAEGRNRVRVAVDPLNTG